MFKTECSEARGPTWTNIAWMVRHLERIWHGTVIIEAVRSPREKGNDTLRWRVQMVRIGWGAEAPTHASVWKDFPHPDHKTVEGLLFQLLHILDSKLEQEAAVIVRQAHF